jgi:hypothetical protein
VIVRSQQKPVDPTTPDANTEILGRRGRPRVPVGSGLLTRGLEVR